MKKKEVFCGLNWCVLSMVAMVLVSCSSALPKGEAKTKSQWSSFEEAKASYDSIILYETVSADLQALGFDPYSTPNVRILSYLDIIRKFSPNDSVKPEDLPPSVLTCITAREKCLGYEASPGVSKSVRVGNVFMDLLKFKRDRIKTGWSFNALIVIDHGIVVYKIWNGIPIIDQEEIRNNPLGPIQESIGSIGQDASGI
ncbi:MAG: hypothetical protein V7699_08400 [Porticoccus sp.]